MSMAATSKELTWTGMVVSRFRDGLVAEEWAVNVKIVVA